MLKNFLFILLILPVVVGCSQNLSTRGNYIFPDKLDQLKKGLSKQEVVNIAGHPTIRASFDENTWYYIYEVSERPVRFIDKRIIDAKVIVINFDKNIVKEVKVFDEKDLRDIPLNINKTDNTLTKTNREDQKNLDSFLLS